jgi:hypothetical protein
MKIVRFRNSGEHKEMLEKIRKMKEFTEDLEECLEDAMDDVEYRDDYHRNYDDMKEGRYDYQYSRRR